MNEEVIEAIFQFWGRATCALAFAFFCILALPAWVAMYVAYRMGLWQ